MLYSNYVCVDDKTVGFVDRTGDSMDCKEFERLIPQFIERKLDFMTLKSFCSHMEKCPACKEELVIQFLVTEGMQRLEEGDAFDLQKELDQRLNEARRKVRFHLRFLSVGEALEVLVLLGIIIAVIWLVI